MEYPGVCMKISLKVDPNKYCRFYRQTGSVERKTNLDFHSLDLESLKIFILGQAEKDTNPLLFNEEELRTWKI